MATTNRRDPLVRVRHLFASALTAALFAGGCGGPSGSGDAADSGGANDAATDAIPDGVSDVVRTDSGATDSGATDSGSGAGVPAPMTGDRILVDSRATLQQATDVFSALAVFPGNDHSDPQSGPGQEGWGFNPDFDGHGTHALVANWQRAAVPMGTCEDHAQLLTAYLPTPLPTRMFLQWKQRLGRAPNDANANGAVNSFIVGSTICNANIGRKEMLVNTEGYTKRYDHTWQLDNDTGGPNGVVNPVLENGDFIRYANAASVFNPQAHVGEVITFTLYWAAASANGANDGSGRLWINSDLVVTYDDVPMTADPFFAFEFPTVFNTPSQDQSEYFWDVVAWEPAH